MKRKIGLGKTLAFVFCLIFAVIWIAPLSQSLMTSLKSEKEINNMIQSKNLNEDIKEKLYLNEDTRSKEVIQAWSELIFPKMKKKTRK